MKFKAFLKRKDIEISLRRYGIDALAAMAKGLFCTLLVGTILDTLGTQLHIGFLNAVICTIGSVLWAAPAVPSAFISSPSSPVNSEKPFPEKQKSIFWLLPS